MQFSRPWTRAMPSATDRTVPTSVSSAPPASRPSMRLLRMEVISSGLICMWVSGSFSAARRRSGLGDLLAKVVESGADGGVEDGVPDAQDDAARGCRGRRWLVSSTLRPGLLADLVADALDGRRVELDGARDLDGQEAVLLPPTARRTRGGCGRSPASGGSRAGARGSSGRPRRRRRGACAGRPSSPRWRSRARRRTSAARGSRRARRRTRRAARGSRRACRARLATSNSARA